MNIIILSAGKYRLIGGDKAKLLNLNISDSLEWVHPREASK